MSHLQKRISVACPLAQAGVRLGDFFREHGNANGDTAKLSLHVDVKLPGLPMRVTLQRAVIVTLQPHRLPGDMTPRFNVQWAPEHPGPFPLFSGELLVESGDDYNTFTICLRGDYTPPLGIAGAGFDFLLGNYVAGVTASNLLHVIRDSIASKFEASEAGKRPLGQPSAVS